MQKISRSAIFLFTISILLYFVWSKLRIYIVIPMSFGQALLTFGIAALVLFLLLDHLINRTR